MPRNCEAEVLERVPAAAALSAADRTSQVIDAMPAVIVELTDTITLPTADRASHLTSADRGRRRSRAPKTRDAQALEKAAGGGRRISRRHDSQLNQPRQKETARAEDS